MRIYLIELWSISTSFFTHISSLVKKLSVQFARLKLFYLLQKNSSIIHCAVFKEPFEFTFFLQKAPSKLNSWTSAHSTKRSMFLQLLLLLRKEVIQPHLPIRLPCYDFTPIIDPTFDGSLLTVRPPASGVTNFRGVTGGVYKARERIHRGMLTRDY